ncbi:hypothetical protein MTR67_033795 [Solanum verrucosum]|uniref:Zinc finger PMZ-type domain-containing protein n=1 Tax=Solanum verrucosum TaxID=315347 RepID=A0AAF0U712_SOLVR|nr:hypothetical protein MTR67_033795 [Solanum verrucosum]
MLKGIPCPHAIAALHHRKLDPINYISHWYNRETYMKTYNYFIQPVMNLKMWPESQNISVIPPPVRKMPGRPGKKRKKEQGETSKTGKLSKRGIEMSRSTCHNKGHNKRKCPLGAPASGTSFTAGPSSRPAAGPSSRPPSGHAAAPTSTQIVDPRATPNAPTERGRGRPKGSTEKGSVASRTRMVGMGALHTQSGATIINWYVWVCYSIREDDVGGEGVGVRVGRGGEDAGWVGKEWRKHRGRGGWGGEDDLGGV